MRSFNTFLLATVLAVGFILPAIRPAQADTPTIVEIAAGNEDFSTLVAAVTAAGLVETLSGEGPFTVFAPTNAAFAALPEGLVETLLKPENKGLLVQVLTYHVVSGKVLAADVVKLKTASTVQGEAAKVTVKDGKVSIDKAGVVATDIMASNGVIHVIDSVIVPQAVLKALAGDSKPAAGAVKSSTGWNKQSGSGGCGG